MIISRSFARRALVCFATLAPACGRTDVDTDNGEFPGIAQTGGAATTGGVIQTGSFVIPSGGSSTAFTSQWTGSSTMTGGTSYHTGGATYGGNTHGTGASAYGGNTYHAGGSAYGGNTYHAGGSAYGGNTATGGTKHSTIYIGGASMIGGKSSIGGTTYFSTSSGGATAISTTGGRTGTGGNSIVGGSTWGGTTYGIGGTKAAGGVPATGGRSSPPRTSLCSIGLTECDADAGAMCVDTQTDTNNCGFCGHTCQSGWHCDAGQCRAPACNGQFMFGPMAYDTHPSSANLSSMIAGDFNRDGLLDLAVSDISNSMLNVQLQASQGGFGSAASFQTGSGPQTVATADLNGDGKLDLVTVNNSFGGMSVLLGNGDGTFATHSDFASGNYVYQLAIGDLDGDAKPDLVAVPSQFGGPQVFIGNGDGTFKAPVDYAASGSINSVAVVDLNGDSRLDVVATNSGNGSVTAWLGNGDGTLGAVHNYAVGSDNPYSLAVGDVNNDTKPDVVVVSTYPTMISVMLNDGSGGLILYAGYSTVGSYTVTLGDLNRDNKLDAILVEPDPSGFLGHVGVRLGLGNGAFAKEVLYPLDPGATAPIVGDFNADGLVDLATASTYNGMLTVTSGNGDGTFYDTISYQTSNCPTLLTLGDVNLDGMLDMLTIGSDWSPGVYFGPIQTSLPLTTGKPLDFAPSQTISGDLDGDGQLDLLSYPRGSSVAVLFGVPGGTFGTQVEVGVDYPQSAVIVDLDHDGWNDIVTINYGSGSQQTVTVNWNLGQRTFSSPWTCLSVPSIADFALADLNADGLPELVFTDNSTIAVALNKGGGAFSTPVHYKVGTAPSRVKIADMNGDGNLDVVVGHGYYSYNFESTVVSIILGQGNGTLGSQLDYPTIGGDCQWLVVDDINGDAHPDVVAITYANIVNVLLGKADGTLANVTATGYLPVYNATHAPIALGDLNGDGLPDLAGLNPNSCELEMLYAKCQ